jgi:predicted O-methyltransferase YrrM
MEVSVVAPTLCDTPPVSAPSDLPAVVSRALELSGRLGYFSSTRHETGRLLAALAASRTGTLAEFGTGCGVGSAWLASGMNQQSRVVTAEVAPRLAAEVATLFAADDRVEVVAGDWSALDQFAPFALLFVDVRDAKQSPDGIADLMEPGGMVVLDDFTPCASWPPVYAGRVDVMREQWLTDERFTSVEVMVSTDSSVVVAVHR